MIVVTRVAKAFGRKPRVQAVSDLSLSASDGQITGLLGPNGAGKTTTLRMIYAVLRPDSGTVTVDGLDASSHPHEVRRHLGVLSDNRGLYPRLTVREHIAYYGRLHGLGPVALAARTTDLSERLGLGPLLDRRVDGMSTGERLKVALARALVHGPRNILLDEPTTGLDVMGTRALREIVRQLRAEGRCVVLSTHVMQEVSALCDQVVVVARGRVTAHGTPDELRASMGTDDLEDAFVAAIGSTEGILS